MKTSNSPPLLGPGVAIFAPAALIAPPACEPTHSWPNSAIRKDTITGHYLRASNFRFVTCVGWWPDAGVGQQRNKRSARPVPEEHRRHICGGLHRFRSPPKGRYATPRARLQRDRKLLSPLGLLVADRDSTRSTPLGRDAVQQGLSETTSTCTATRPRHGRDGPS
jgi:hypothetical protein